MDYSSFSTSARERGYGTVQWGALSGVGKSVVPRRRRLNLLAILVAWTVPSALAASLAFVLSFALRYWQPSLAFTITGLAFLGIVFLAIYAWDTRRQRALSTIPREPSWTMFVAITAGIAWLGAVILGSVNYRLNMTPYYEMMGLNIYQDVDPVTMRGQQLMDAGQVQFAEGSHLALNMSMGFKNLDYYCVAPITGAGANGSDPSMVTYDFWAVGINCCTSVPGSFHCGIWSDPRGQGGLRLMDDSQRPYFRLAVQQASAAFRIQAVHPLFFYWTIDPVSETKAIQEKGKRLWYVWTVSYCTFQLGLVAIAALVFAKMGAY